VGATNLRLVRQLSVFLTDDTKEYPTLCDALSDWYDPHEVREGLSVDRIWGEIKGHCSSALCTRGPTKVEKNPYVVFILNEDEYLESYVLHSGCLASEVIKGKRQTNY